MKKVSSILGYSFLSFFILTSCGSSSKEKKEDSKKTDEKTSKSDTLNVNQKKDSIESKELVYEKLEEEIKLFLISTENTYGWETKSNDISLDFFKDGRLHIQGPDGESTMWQGKWRLKGDQLTMERPDLEKNITVTAKINGKNLLLDNIIYKRYKP